ncbi:MAG: hypothetical protein WCF84_12515 [Anaerolineae bacterium]
MSMKRSESEQGFAVCLKNDGYAAALEVRKIYRVIQDEQAKQHNLMSIVDESGEDYLYPTDFFAAIELPDQVVKALALAA